MKQSIFSNRCRSCSSTGASPTHKEFAIRRIEEGAVEGQNGTELVALRRGLIPFWAKGVAPRFGTIMATREPL